MITFFYQFILFFVKIFLNLLNLKKITQIIKLKEENQIFKKKNLQKYFFIHIKLQQKAMSVYVFLLPRYFFQMEKEKIFNLKTFYTPKKR